ncbi:MAG TPA: hypothetical protein VHD35_07270, partial [Chitinophagaceae bacterium]|nr:hypothetical protein [Chitinophagaceae bacterium]
GGIAILYLLMNISVMGVVPWQSVKEDDRYLVSTFMEQVYGHSAGIIICCSVGIFKGSVCSGSGWKFS